jgi:hypothetical protein
MHRVAPFASRLANGYNMVYLKDPGGRVNIAAFARMTR